jgi:hypothetical protein
LFFFVLYISTESQTCCVFLFCFCFSYILAQKVRYVFFCFFSSLSCVPNVGSFFKEKQNKKTKHIWLSALIGYTRWRKTTEENTTRLTFCANLCWHLILFFLYISAESQICFFLFFFFFVLCTQCWQFLWIVHFLLSLQFSITLILYQCATVSVLCWYSYYFLSIRKRSGWRDIKIVF